MRKVPMAVMLTTASMNERLTTDLAEDQEVIVKMGLAGRKIPSRQTEEVANSSMEPLEPLEPFSRGMILLSSAINHRTSGKCNSLPIAKLNSAVLIRACLVALWGCREFAGLGRLSAQTSNDLSQSTSTFRAAGHCQSWRTITRDRTWRRDRDPSKGKQLQGVSCPRSLETTKPPGRVTAPSAYRCRRGAL